MSKQIKFIAVILVLAGAGYYVKTHFMGAKTPEQNKQQASTGAPVSAAFVIEKEVTEWSEFSGRLEAMDNVEVKARVSGAIEKVHFQDGSLVKQGDPLFTIDQRPYSAEVEKAKGALASAESAYRNAVTDLERAKGLLSSSNISKRDYDARESNVRITEGNVKAAKGNLDAAQVNLDYTVIKAPISGKVSRAEITEGNVITSGVNTPVLTNIVSLSPIYASFEVDEQTFLQNIYNTSPESLKNIPVKINLADDGAENIIGKIHSFDNQLNVASGTIRVRATIDNEDGKLVPGLFARVRLGSPEAKKAILVNEKAIGTDQSKKFVYVVSPNNTAEYHEVTLGQPVDGLRVVHTGLKSGDKIIVNGLVKVRPNAPVQPEMVDMTSLDDKNPQNITGDKPNDGPAEKTTQKVENKSETKSEDKAQEK